MFLVVLENFLENRESVDVLDLAQTVGHLVAQQRRFAVEACVCAGGELVPSGAGNTSSSPFPMMSMAFSVPRALRVKRARNLAASGVACELS